VRREPRGSWNAGAVDPVRQLGDILRAEGYDDRGLAQAYSGVDLWKAKALRGHGVLEGGRLAALSDLFRQGVSLEPAVAVETLDPVPPELLQAEKMLHYVDGWASSLVRIDPWLDLLLAHDPYTPAELHEAYVAGGNRSAETLARATIRRSVGAALDLGTGAGMHALLMAPHAERVYAADINPRALWYAQLNARLNAVDNVETREGSWLVPVEGERFDVVTANPPYVISPDIDYLFRDSPGELHELCRGLIRALPGYLNEEGVAHVLCNWATREGETPWQVVGEWTHGLGCDVLVLNFGQEDLVSYASRWTEPLAAKEETEYASAVQRWLEYYREQRLETIWFGLVLLRRRSGRPNWFRGIGAPEFTTGFASDHLLRLLAAQDWLAGQPAVPPVLGERFALVPHTLEQELDYDRRQGGYAKARSRLRLVEGLGVAAPVEADALPVVVLLDGTRTLAEAIDEVARARHDISEEALAHVARPVVLNLFELGLLERA
jgi:methylase of polypeptide subunit release factors